MRLTYTASEAHTVGLSKGDNMKQTKKQLQERIDELHREVTALRNRAPIATIDGEPVESAIVYVTNATVTQDALPVDMGGYVRYLPGMKSLTLEATGPFPYPLTAGRYALIPLGGGE